VTHRRHRSGRGGGTPPSRRGGVEEKVVPPPARSRAAGRSGDRSRNGRRPGRPLEADETLDEAPSARGALPRRASPAGRRRPSFRLHAATASSTGARAPGASPPRRLPAAGRGLLGRGRPGRGHSKRAAAAARRWALTGDCSTAPGSREERTMHFETPRVPSGRRRTRDGGVALRSTSATTFERDAAGQPVAGHGYIREHGSHARRRPPRERLAPLEGGEAALAFASGWRRRRGAAGAPLGDARRPAETSTYGYRVAAKEFLPAWGSRRPSATRATARRS